VEKVTVDELFGQSQVLLTQAKAIAEDAASTTEDMLKASGMVADATALRERSKMLTELEAAMLDVKAIAASGVIRADESAKFGSFGDMLGAIHGATFLSKRDPRLVFSSEAGAGGYRKTGWPGEEKVMAEGTGATGGFIVFPEYLTEVFRVDPLDMIVRPRAFTIPMRARTIQVPVLDQTGTATDRSNYYAGMKAQWIEEAKLKDESEPAFRQMELIAHKLVIYTESSDELLADSAVALEALLSGLFRSTIMNEEEWTFVNGTGAGQPLGIVNAGVTIGVARQVAATIGITDIFNMLGSFQGRNPVWMAHQNTLPQLLGMAGPAGSPSYVWIGNGRDNMPTTLMGYPIFFIENCQPLGTKGDIILADWSKYYIGDRQLTTVDASKHYKFQYDITCWRAVHRVDGRPVMSAPITFRDGVTQVSPFVVLDGVGGS